MVPLGPPVVLVVVTGGVVVVVDPVVVVTGDDVVVDRVVVTGEVVVVVLVVGLVLPPSSEQDGFDTVPEAVPWTPTPTEPPAGTFAAQPDPVTTSALPELVAVAPQADETPTEVP